MFYLLFSNCLTLPRAHLLVMSFTLTRHSIIAALREICKVYHERLFLCESQKWDLEYEVRKRDYEVKLPILIDESGVFVVMS